MGISMNYMEQVAQMLGVELEEEFKINRCKYLYKFTKDGMLMRPEFTSDWLSANHMMLCVLIGKYKIKKPILDEVEKEYLSGIIKPFRSRVIDIGKCNCCEYEYLVIKYLDIGKNEGFIYLPCFKRDTMYKGMKVDKKYTLEDLGL